MQTGRVERTSSPSISTMGFLTWILRRPAAVAMVRARVYETGEKAAERGLRAVAAGLLVVLREEVRW